ncbi:MAG: HAD-IC family P-type ATPase, partial [Hyphomonadaceae bacterium]|nr:HAD-IC family P-type ATPase [Clostridia bacterium]
MVKIKGFAGDYEGLSQEQVSDGQKQHGLNELVPEKKRTFLRKALQVLSEPMFILLFFTSILYFVLGEMRDGAIMLAFIVFMVSINIFQEWRTDKTLDALKDQSSPQVRVFRDGVVTEIECKHLTIGDLMLLEEGEKISADGQIIEMRDLGVDESTLTGEAEVVWKTLKASDTDHWRKDYIYAGTTVTQGNAVVKVTAIGTLTEYGKIGKQLSEIKKQQTPLEKQTASLVKTCATIGGVLLVLVFIVSYWHNRDLRESTLSAITLAMSMIPEEFPVILTVFLAMGAYRIAKQSALIRSMPSVETLGAVSVLCVDKTGTLTKNQMTVDKIYAPDGDEKEVMHWAGLACETEPYDPMEKAMLACVAKLGICIKTLFSKKLLHEYAFSTETKMMGHIWSIDGATTLAAKGSPESILPLCGLSQEQLGTIQAEQERMASEGIRVIAVANRTNMTDIPIHLADNTLTFVGLVGLLDPPREEVQSAIAVCNRAGIRVVMITGDNGMTA